MQVGRLQKKIVVIILAIVVVPMLVAGGFTAAWVSSSFEQRIQAWVSEAVRSGQQWLEANQNDALLLGRILADDPRFVASLQRDPRRPAFPGNVQKIANELGISVVRVYSSGQRLLYSASDMAMDAHWEPGQTQAVFRVGGAQSQLAAVGIVPVPNAAKPRFYLVLGSLLDDSFISDLSHLTGLKTRLYYREQNRFVDIFNTGGTPIRLQLNSPDELRQLVDRQQPFYSTHAESGRYRGLYLPIADSQGHVEAILFGGIARVGAQELLTNSALMFAVILALGLVIGTLTGWLLARYLVRPITLLRDGVLQVAGKNYEVAVQVYSDDELGDLAQAFNAMAASIRQARDEDQLHFQTDKLAALGELSASLAHEIRNPIGVINTAAAMLQRSDDEERRQQLLAMVQSESQRISELVGEFLQLSRHRTPQRQSIDAALPLHQALEAQLAGRADVQVIDNSAAASYIIDADTGLLRQAWGNIIHNALQAMGEEGGTLKVNVYRNGSSVMVSLQDSGPGIAPEVLPRLFEPFFTTKERGTGLGLSIAYSLVEANHGRLELIPSDGAGACLAMRFPLAERSSE